MSASSAMARSASSGGRAKKQISRILTISAGSMEISSCGMCATGSELPLLVLVGRSFAAFGLAVEVGGWTDLSLARFRRNAKKRGRHWPAPGRLLRGQVLLQDLQALQQVERLVELVVIL